MVSSSRFKLRRTVAVVIILAVVASLILTLLTQPYSSPDPERTTPPIGSLFWVVQILVSFIAILASLLQLVGVDMLELIGSRPAGTNVEAFPFHVVSDFDELLDHLFPDPTVPLLSDRSIHFLPRIANELDTALHEHGRILVRGRSKTGKTREVLEMLERWWHTGPTVLLAKNHANLHPPYEVPATLPTRNLVLFFDDVERYCGDGDAVKRLDQTISFFAKLCHGPEELRVVATVRQEPEFWRKLHYDEVNTPWNTFELISLPPLPPDDARHLINQLSRHCDISIDPDVVEHLVVKNDGTFLNLVLSFREWLHTRVKQVGPEQAAAFEGNLLTTWRRRYERMAKLLPEAGPIYAAIDLLQTLDVPLRPMLITELATEMSLGRAYHLVGSLFHWTRSKVDLLPWFDWYRDPRRRLLGLALGIVCAVLALYGLFYVVFCILPPDLQQALFTAIGEELKWQLLMLSPLMIPLIPMSISLVLRMHHRQRRRRIQRTLDRLLETEVPLRGEELRPYEGQFEGNGASRAWPPAFFSGKCEVASLHQAAASRLGASYLKWAEGLRRAGELGPARSLATIAGALAPAHPASSFMLGTLWFDEGDFGRALAEFERSRRRNPTASAALALERIAWCQYQLGDFEQAEIAAERALALMPSLSGARWVRGLARLQRNQIEAGLSDCQQAARTREEPPPGFGAFLDSALAAASSQNWASEVRELVKRERPVRKRRTALWHRLQRGLAIGLALLIVAGCLVGAPYVSPFNLVENPDFAEQLMDGLLMLYPRAPALLTMRGFTHIRSDEYELAIADLTAAIQLAPEYATAYSNRGYAYSVMSDYEQAIADYTEALRLDPGYILLYRNRGLVYEELGDYNLAIASYTEAIRLDPQDAWTYRRRGDLYAETGNIEQAIADYSEAIRVDSDPAYAYRRRGDLYREIGDYERAIADYTEAIRIAPEPADAYCYRGDLYAEMGNNQQAIADYSEAIRVDPNCAYAYQRRGDLYTDKCLFEQAIADYTEAIRIAPERAWFYRSRGFVYYYWMNEYELAIADYTEAIRIAPDDRLLYYHERADAYFRMGDYERAIADYTKSISIAPEWWIYLKRGDVYAEKGDYERAIADFTESIRINPYYAGSYAGRGRAHLNLGDSEQAITDFRRAAQLYGAEGNSEDAALMRDLVSSLDN
jgi:tetratricopeptide (TPR) repeat protein